MMFEAIGRMGDAILKSENDARVAHLNETMPKAAANEAERAIAEKRLVKRREDDTYAGQVFNQSLKRSYFVELELSFDEQTDQLVRKYGKEPEKFQKEYDKMAGEFKSRMPEDWQRPMEHIARQKFRRAFDPIARQAMAQAEAEKNAINLDGMQRYENNYAQALRDMGRYDEADPEFADAQRRAQEAKQKWATSLADRSDLLPQKKVVINSLFEKQGRGEIVLGEFGRALRSGLGEARRFVDKLEKDGPANDGIENVKERRALVADLRKRLGVAEVDDLRGRAQGATDTIVSEGGTLDEQLKAARDITDKNLRDAVVGRVKTRFNERQTIAQAAERQRTEQFWTGFMQNPNIDAIPADLPVATKKAAEAYARTRAKGQEPETDWKAYDKLNRMTRRELAEADILEYRDRLSDGDFKRFSDLQRSARSKDTVERSKLTTVQKLNGLVNSTLKTINIKPDSEKGVLFKRRLQDEITAAETEAGKKLTRDEQVKIIDRLMLDGEVKGTFWDPSKRAYEVKSGEKFQIDGVPDKYLDEIVSDLQAAGVRATTASIQEAYGKAKAKGLVD